MAEYKKVVNDEPIKEGTNSEQRTFDVPTFPEGEYKGQTVSETLGTNSGELSPNPNYEAQEVLWFDGNRFLKGSAIYQAWVTAKAKPEENRTPFEKWLVEDGEIEVTSQLTKQGTVEGTETIVGTPKTEGIKVEQSIINFLNGLLVKGKKIEDYIDSQGGVTEEELQAALATLPKLYVHKITFSQSNQYPSNATTVKYLTTFKTPITKDNINTLIFDPSKGYSTRDDILQVGAYECYSVSGKNNGCGLVTKFIIDSENSNNVYTSSISYDYLFGSDTVIEL